MNDNEIVICFKCRGTGKGLHNEGICKECEGSGRLKKVVTYMKYGSVVEEATRLLGDDVEEEEDQEDFEDYLKKALVKNGMGTSSRVRTKRHI